eukprot:1290650-Pyramimonas_sp.AAC.1
MENSWVPFGSLLENHWTSSGNPLELIGTVWTPFGNQGFARGVRARGLGLPAQQRQPCASAA